MSTFPQFMINPETDALFLIMRRNDTGSHTGYILHDHDFKTREPGAHSAHWKKLLVPLKNRYALSTLVPGEYPMLMVSKTGDNLYLVNEKNHDNSFKGVRIASKNTATIGYTSHCFHSLEPFDGPVELFNT